VKQVIVVLKKENIEASDLLNWLRSDKALSDAHIQRLNDSIRAKRTRINALESSASTSSAPFFPAAKDNEMRQQNKTESRALTS
jgi:hypothetical protein